MYAHHADFFLRPAAHIDHREEEKFANLEKHHTRHYDVEHANVGRQRTAKHDEAADYHAEADKHGKGYVYVFCVHIITFFDHI